MDRRLQHTQFSNLLEQQSIQLLDPLCFTDRKNTATADVFVVSKPYWHKFRKQGSCSEVLNLYVFEGSIQPNGLSSEMSSDKT